MPDQRTILLVEPDSSVRQALAEALASESYAVALAADGGSAIRHLQQRDDIDAVVAGLPHGAGYPRHVLDRLRRVQPGLPMIVLTTTRGFGQAQSPRAGVVLLEKPLDLVVLFQTLRVLTARPANLGARAQVSSASCLR
jgi:DNA-binding NtrC family response regulator